MHRQQILVSFYHIDKSFLADCLFSLVQPVKPFVLLEAGAAGRVDILRLVGIVALPSSGEPDQMPVFVVKGKMIRLLYAFQG